MVENEVATFFWKILKSKKLFQLIISREILSGKYYQSGNQVFLSISVWVYQKAILWNSMEISCFLKQKRLRQTYNSYFEDSICVSQQITLIVNLMASRLVMNACWMQQIFNPNFLSSSLLLKSCCYCCFTQILPQGSIIKGEWVQRGMMTKGPPVILAELLSLQLLPFRVLSQHQILGNNIGLNKKQKMCP